MVDIGARTHDPTLFKDTRLPLYCAKPLPLVWQSGKLPYSLRTAEVSISPVNKRFLA